MAIPTINFAGYVYNDAGTAVSGASVNLYAKNTTTTSLASDTTDSNGRWDINYTTAGTSGLDIQIQSGESYRRIKYQDKIHLEEVDTALLNIRGVEGAAAAMYFFADEGEDAGDRWNISVADAGVMTMGNDLNSQGTYVAHVTLTPNATVANSTFAVAGNLTVGNALTVTGTTTLNGNLVLGDAVASDTLTVGATLQGGTPLVFEGATADGHETSFVITDPTADRTITFPNLTGTVQLSGNPITGTTIDASTDFTIGNTVITDGVITDSTGLQLAANLDIDGTVDISGDLTLSAGGDGALVFGTAGENSIKIPDNQASALIIEEANNAYITFTTTNSSEAITVAKPTTFSGALDINAAVDISGDLTLSAGGDGALVFATAGENSIKIPDNQGSALIIEEANNAYMTFVTTDSSEAVSIAKTLTLSTVAAAGTDTDKFLVLDGSGNVDYRTGTQVLSDIGGTGATALDDISTGDAAASLVTTVGNITIDAQANDADVIIKVDDNGSAVTAVTFDGSDEGNALFVNDIKLISDSSVLSLGDGGDFTITHDGTTGATLAGNPITITSGGAATWSSSAGALTITSAAAATWSTAAGVLTIDGDDGIVLNTGGSGNVQVNENFLVGVDDTGYDVTFFGASAGAYMLYDQSEDKLVVMGASADATTSTGKLLLATSLTDVNANDVIGKVEFQAPHEAGGTDAITVAASIEAVAQGTFAADLNSTDLLFKTGHSEAATEKFRITSQGELGVGGANYGTDGQVLTSTGAGTAPAWENAAGGGSLEFVSKTTTTGTVSSISITGFTADSVYKMIGKKILMSGSGHVRMKPFLDGGGSVTTGACDYVVDRPGGSNVYTDQDYFELYTYGYEDDYFEFEVDFSTDTYGWIRGPGHPSGNTSNPNGYTYLYGHLHEAKYDTNKFSGFQMVNGGGNDFTSGCEILLYKWKES